VIPGLSVIQDATILADAVVARVLGREVS